MGGGGRCWPLVSRERLSSGPSLLKGSAAAALIISRSFTSDACRLIVDGVEAMG